MTDTPRLPASPMSVAVPDPRHAAWRRWLLWVSAVLLVISGVVVGTSTVMYVITMGWPTSLARIAQCLSGFVVVLPVALPELIGLQVARRGARTGLWASLAARVVPLFTIAGAVGIYPPTPGYWPERAISIASIGAAVVVFAIPSGRPAAVVKWLNGIAALACAGMPGFFIAMVVDRWMGGVIEVVAVAVAGALMLLCLTMCALILTEPTVEALADS